MNSSLNNNFAWSCPLVSETSGSERLLIDPSARTAQSEKELCLETPRMHSHGQAPSLPSFAQYFSEENIIKQLCRQRLKLAEQIRSRFSVTQLIGEQMEDPDAEAYSLLPPRKQWSRFRPKCREKVSHPNLAALRRAVAVLKEAQPDQSWVIRLADFIGRLRARVISREPFVFRQPNVIWQEKKGGSHEYRALCRFSLEDNIIIGLTAEYLRELFDSCFEDSSYAFRARVEGRRMPTHHAAFDAIHGFRTSTADSKLYVAECDIRGFYDSVDHIVAKGSLNHVSDRLRLLNPSRSLDLRAREIFEAFLECYDFPRNVLTDALPRLVREDRDGRFPWPSEALKKHHADPFAARIGVPQGGALSCFISNLILDHADKRVKEAQLTAKGQVRYFRYCDDMILIAVNQKDCSRAFDAYLTALEELKLPFHEPKPVGTYGKDFWSAKSKQPYCWTGKRNSGCVPWVQFVGYQVRYDGLVRIKRDSIEKHLIKLRSTTDEFKFGLLKWNTPNPEDDVGEPIAARKGQAATSLEQRLENFGVGRLHRKRIAKGPRPMCWASGYKALHGKPFVPTFVKRFDRERQRQIRRFKRANIFYGDGIARSGSSGKRLKGFWASYTAQFNNAGGKNLILNPYRTWKQKMWRCGRAIVRWASRLLST